MISLTIFDISRIGWTTPVSLFAYITEAIRVFALIDFLNSSIFVIPSLSHETKLTLNPLLCTFSAEARTASCSICVVVSSAEGSLSIKGVFIIQLSASVPPLVNVISLGAAPKQLAINSLDSSSMFLAFRDNAWPPEEFA